MLLRFSGLTIDGSNSFCIPNTSLRSCAGVSDTAGITCEGTVGLEHGAVNADDLVPVRAIAKGACLFKVINHQSAPTECRTTHSMVKPMVVNH
jgi:hypothetical protein